MAKQTDLESGEVKTNKTGEKPVITDAETEIIGNKPNPKKTNPDETILVGGLKNRDAIPTVGWLVVWVGEGQGISHNLFPGLNKIGRGDKCDVRVDHGDSSISREGHVGVTYDEEAHDFTVVNNGSKNPPRINKVAIHTQGELKSGDILKIGKTELVFVPFCSPERNWS
jgi:hypothetical protein